MILANIAQSLYFTPRDKIMECKAPDFPEIVLAPSKCGRFEFFKTDKLLVAAFPESVKDYGDGVLIYAFYKRDFSNFSAVKALDVACDYDLRQRLLNVRYDCSEQFFKAMCAILHVDPETGKNLEVLEAVLNAAEPSKAKSATFKLKDFDRTQWDAVSLEVMIAAQMYKVRDPVYRDRMLEVARLAFARNIKSKNVYFIEATEPTPATDTKPEYPADFVWGSGVGVGKIFEELSANGLSENFKHYLVDPIKDSKAEDGMAIDGVRLGGNRLGEALNRAFSAVVCLDYWGLNETMEQFLQRCMSRLYFDFLRYDDTFLEQETSTNKRSRREVDSK